MNFNVPLPPPYYREIWDYKHANTENIQKAISMFDWHKAFKNKNTNEMARIPTNTLREKCPNTELFLVRMRENTDQKLLRIWTLFTQ